MTGTLRRAAHTAGLAVRQPVRRALGPHLPPVYGAPDGALDAALAWLCRSHDVTGRRGSTKGFSLLRGWMPPYPETSGYIVGTFLQAGERDRPQLMTRGRELADWEIGQQKPDGGIMTGDVSTRPRRSVIFNTGMVLHGWLDWLERGEERYAGAAARAVAFLVDGMAEDGTWRPEREYQGIPHTYNARVAWALLRYGRLREDERAVGAAHRHLTWTVARQSTNGWFDSCVFRPASLPSTHGIADTLRGLLESHAITGHPEHRRSPTDPRGAYPQARGS